MAQGRGFIVGLLILSALLIIGVIALKSQMGFPLDLWKVYVTNGCFFLVTLLSHYSMAKAVTIRPTLFANRYMASILIKLVVGFVLFLAIGLSSDKPQVIPFGLYFIAAYLLYTIYGSHQAMKLKDGKG